MKFLATIIGLIASCLLLTHCGGGGSDETKSPPTIRPKTLDGINLTFSGFPLFEFVRNTGTAAALNSGDVESGTFFYTLLPGVQARQFPNIQGDNSDVHWPDEMSSASYTYRAINDTSAMLTLNGIGVNDLILTGSFNALNGSFCYFFNADSAGNVVNQVVVDLTFATNGGNVTVGTTTVRIPGSTLPNFDTVRIPATILLAAGGLVPENYNPKIDFLRPSRLCPASLDNTLVIFTNGIPNPANDFTIQFSADAAGLPRTGTNTPDEIGNGILRVAGANPVDNAVDYTWRRVPGTDYAALTVSGSNTTYDGKYTLYFLSTDNGSYAGEVDAGTPTVAEVSGIFSIPKPP